MTDDSLFKLIEEMRKAQIAFFKKKGTLNDAVVLERRVDIALQERKVGKQATMLNLEENG